jgi:hypothetical protein
MSPEWAEFIYFVIGSMAVLATLGMLRVLAGYREQTLLIHDMAREVQRIRAEYLRRLNASKAAEEAEKKA